MERNKKNRRAKRTAIIATLLACVLLIGGTVAWLVSTSQLTNTFTVGNINPIDPDPDKEDPDKPGPVDPETPINPDDETKFNGNLYEPNWVADSKIFPGATIAKDPYVGIGPGSEAAYVYVYVKNTMNNRDHVYFNINAGWEAVEGCTFTTGTEGEYTGGLFKYTAGLNATNSEFNVWTTAALFDEVVAKEAASASDFMTPDETTPGVIEVHSFLHQKYDGEGVTIDESVALTAAKAAFGLQ